MKRYRHNPELYRDHFTGRGLPAFQGQRTHRGRGRGKRLLKKLKRVAVPLLKAGARAAAPHVSGITRTVATKAAKAAFGDNPAMQQVIGQVAGRVAEGVMGRALQKKRNQRGRGRRKRNGKLLTGRNIFDKNVDY